MSSDAWTPRVATQAAGGRIAPRAARVITSENEPVISPIAWRVVGASAEPPKPVPVPGVEAAAQLAQLRQDCERQVKEAKTTGFREGETAGRSRAAAEAQPVMEKLARAIEEIGQLRHRLRREAESDTIKLSLAIARRILRRELAVDPDAMRGLVMAAIEKLQAQEINRVKAHPAQAPQIGACLRALAPNLRAEVIPDASLAPGGVIFETNHGNLDASVDSQLQEIERGLTDRLRGHA